MSWLASYNVQSVHLLWMIFTFVFTAAIVENALSYVYKDPSIVKTVNPNFLNTGNFLFDTDAQNISVLESSQNLIEFKVASPISLLPWSSGNV